MEFEKTKIEKKENSQSKSGRKRKERKEEGEKDKSEESGVKVSTIKTKTKSQLAREARGEIPPASSKEALYPLVPSKKDMKCYFKWFLDIFQKLEITIPFGEAIQQISLYKKSFCG